jgi:hypothetical protein
MGGEPLEANGVPLPSYYDPRYGCEMQILRFDSRRPSETYASLVDRLCDRMTNVEVVARVERPMPGVAINAPMWSPAAGHPRSSVILAS